MEALGVASGVAGLISLADVIAFKISRYYSLVKGAKSDIRELLLEVQSLYGVLNSLKLLAQCLEETQASIETGTISQMDHFQTCRRNLDYLKRSLSKLELDSSKPVAVVKTKLLWPFKAQETKELVEKISRNKSDLAEALTADGLAALVNALSSQGKLIESVETVQKQIQKLAIEKAENEQAGAGKTILTSAVIEQAKIIATETTGIAMAYYYCEYRLPETQKLSNIVGSLIRQLCGSSEEAFQELESYYRKCNPDRKDPIFPTDDELGEMLGQISNYFESVMVVVDGLDEIADPEDRSQILELLSSLNSSDYGTIKCVYTSRDEIDIRQQFTQFESISIAARGNDLELYVASVIETRMQNRTLRMKDPHLKETIINGIVSKANGMFQYAKCQLDYLCTLSTDKERRNALATLPVDLFETYRRILMRVSQSTRGNQRLVERTLRWVALAGDQLPADAFPTAVAVEIGARDLDPDDLPDEHSILRWCSSLITKDDRLNTLSFSHFTVREFLEDEKLLGIEELKEFYLDWNDSQTIIAKVCLTYLCMPEFSLWVVNSYKEIEPKLEKLPLLKYACHSWTDHAEARKYNTDGIAIDTTLFQLTCELFHPRKSSNFILWVHVYWNHWRGIGHPNGEKRSIPLSASPLHHAALLGYANVCTWLLDQGVDANAFDTYIGTPLLCAVAGDHSVGPARLDILRILLKHGAHGGHEIEGHREMLRAQIVPYGTPMSRILDHAKQQPEYACNMFRELLAFSEVSTFAKSSFWVETVHLPPPPPHIPRASNFPAPPPPMSQPRRLGTFDNSTSAVKLMVELFKETLNHKALALIDEESKAKMLSYLIEHDTENPNQEVLSSQSLRANIANLTMPDQIASVAAKNGQVELIQAFIEESRDPQMLARCLPIAASAGYVTIVEVLLDYCLPHISLASENVRIAWLRAALSGSTACLAAFVRHGLDPNIVVTVYDLKFSFAPKCGTALSGAISCGMLDVVEYLLDFPAPHLRIRAGGLPLLHLAARAPRNRKEMIKLLLQHGSDPSERSDHGSSVLHHLLLNPNHLNSSDLEIVHQLVDEGCDLEAIDDEGNNLLHAFFSWPSYIPTMCFDALKQFILSKGTMNFRKNKAGILPLQMALRSHQQPDIIRVLLPPEVSSWNCADQRKYGPLHEAVMGKDLLGTLGVYDSGLKSRFIRFPGERSCELASLEMLLSRNGVDANVRDEQGNTPLLIKLSQHENFTHASDQHNIFRQLLRTGADINIANDGGFTALHLVFQRGSEEDLKLILSYKPNIATQTKQGNTVFHIAVGGPSNLALFRVLLEYCRTIPDQQLGDIRGLDLMNENGYLPIHLACEKQNKDIVGYLLDIGCVPDVNVRTEKSHRTLLHFIASWDSHTPAAATVLDLIDRGADVNAVDKQKRTPLHEAADAGNLEVLKILVERGARIDIKSSFGYTAWMCAAMNSHTEVMTYLTECAESEHMTAAQSASKTEPRSSDEDDFLSSSSDDEADATTSSQDMPGFEIGQRDAMKKALRNSDYNLCQGLLEMPDADPNLPLTARDKETALHRARKPSIVKLLLGKGARVDSLDVWGCPPIHEQAREGYSENLKILVEAGAKLDARNFWMTTPMHWAASNGHLETVKMIVKLAESQATTASLGEAEGSSTFVQSLLEYRNSNGETGFLAALEGEHVEVAQFLLDYGVNIFACDRWGHSALWHACCFAKQPFIETLLARGLDVNNSSISGISCLYNILDRDVSNQDELNDLAMLLINSGANLASNPTGQSPLHMACFTGNLTIVKELLARVDQRELGVESEYTGTPLWAASFRGKVEVVKALFATGWEFDINIGKHGESPLEAACVQLHWEVARILEERGAVRTKEIQHMPVKIPGGLNSLGAAENAAVSETG